MTAVRSTQYSVMRALRPNGIHQLQALKVAPAQTFVSQRAGQLQA
jgi:hypothetical protein